MYVWIVFSPGGVRWRVGTFVGIHNVWMGILYISISMCFAQRLYPLRAVLSASSQVPEIDLSPLFSHLQCQLAGDITRLHA